MKRTLSLVLALVMVLGTFTMAFADMTDAQMEAGALLEDLGVLEGDGEGDLYLDSALKRQDAVIMLSRLMGEEEIAKNFPVEEEDMYPDVEDSFYFGYLAWAKANGTFEGKGTGEFGFDAIIDANSYAKVLLTALGYEQGVDFEYEEVLEFANEKGIVVVEENGNITRGTMAVMTVEALAVEMKDGSMTLAEKLEIELPEVVPAEIKVENVTATNLKQIMVEFNGKVDEASATKLDNYTFEKELKSAELLEDEMTVLLTLKEKEDDTLTNQKEYKLTVNNVLLADSEVELTKVEKKFTAIDNTLPTVKEVVGLGTKAIQVIFSEPVVKNTASRITSYKIDDKVFSGSIKYVYPNSVIISTNMSVGEHELSVKNVEDFAEFKVQEPGFEFTIVEDNEAPEIVSAKSVDLYEVEVVFNEPVKSISNGYHTSKSNLATRPYDVSGEKVTLNFKNAMTLGNTEIFIDGVEDYSGNKSDRTVTITPELDTTRPEVVAVDVEDGKEFTIVFSKKMFEDDVIKGANYVIKDSDGDVPAGYGLNSKGNPIRVPKYDESKREVTFELVKPLPKESYTLEISGIRDKSYIKNTMLPHTEVFSVGDTGKPSVTKAWVEDEGSYRYIYVQFSEAVATEGNGNALELVKYNYSNNGANENATWKPIPTKSTIDLVGEDAVRINLPKDEDLQDDNGNAVQGIRVTLVSDLEENFMAGLVGYESLTSNAQRRISVTEVKATDTDTIKVTFDGKLITVSASDFKLEGPENVELVYDTFEYDGGETIATFKLRDDKKLSEDVYGSNDEYTFRTVIQDINKIEDIESQDAYGARVNITANEVVLDRINPTINTDVAVKVANDNKSVTIEFNEEIKADYVAGVVSVKVNGTKKTVTGFSENGKELTINVDLGNATDTDIVEVEILEANKTVKAIKDEAGNAATPDTIYNN
jgi:Big-like domain-containing protein